PRARDVRALGRAAVQPVGTVVALVAPAVPRRLDLRTFSPLVVARDRDEIRACRPRRPPHRVVRRAVEARLDTRVARCWRRLVAGTDRRRAQDSRRVRLLAEAPELPAVV